MASSTSKKASPRRKTKSPKPAPIKAASRKKTTSGGNGRKKQAAVPAPKAATNGSKIDASTNVIEIHGARTHNLKNISVRIPHEAMTVITGVSGSGKSSLAFDTLFAEGQRRFVESMSTYARQFLDKMARPDVDSIQNIQPAIALEQKNPVTAARSTVGTATELNDYLRLLYARCGQLICPDCDILVEERTPHGAAVELIRLFPETRVYLTAPVQLENPDLANALRMQLREMGFSRLWWQGEITEIDDLSLEEMADYDQWEVLIDRLKTPVADAAPPPRLTEAVRTGMRVGKGKFFVREHQAEGGSTNPPRIFHEGLVCESCGRNFRSPEPALFSFDSPLGACKTCEGLGRTIGIDWSKCIPNHSLSINEGAIACWNTDAHRHWLTKFKQGARSRGISLDKPIRSLTQKQREFIRHGDDTAIGLQDFFDDLANYRYKVHVRITLARYRAYEECRTCGGSRLVPEALAFKANGKSIWDIQSQPIADLKLYYDSFEFRDEARREASQRLLQEIRGRLTYLDRVGLGYLTLGRQTRTLSGGEAQRINLATALGSALTDTLYVLDEPTVGLHSRDTHRLLDVLHRLRDQGNTVVVVEHDKEVMRASNHLIDIGPNAGERGGELMFEGSVETLEKEGDSLTANFLREDHKLRLKTDKQARQPTDWLEVRGARGNNLKDVDVKFPLGVFACVTGVSGSGKTTLVRDTLFAGYRRLAEQAAVEIAEHDELLGWEDLSEMTFVDQAPIGRSSRSNPVTYIKAYDEIRKLMAKQPEARRLGRSEGDFSFNVRGGRCDQCEGTGFQTVDLHFLGEVNVECEACSGTRFKDFMLSIRYRGKNIHDILNLTLDEAVAFFADEPKVARALKPLQDVGLGYLRLGQSTATLSGGELQRLKLATYLITKASGEPQLLIFDEPTTGLHPSDLDQLLDSFERLVDAGYSLLVIEHNLDLIARADYLIDLGPEGGDGGGEVVYAGPPRGLASKKKSITGQYLKRLSK
jgi:excinuclease ABC subunit A